jgi:hypothetical protein
VEDQNSRFDVTGSANHGRDEYCPRNDRDGHGRASDLPCGSTLTRIQEIVMAKLIEFYIPKNFRKPFRTSPQPLLGKVIEFCRQTKRSA